MALKKPILAGLIGESIEIITKSNFKINLIQPNNFDFFDTLRNKLNWGYDFRN